MSFNTLVAGDYTTAEAIQIVGQTNTYNLLSASGVVKFMVGPALTTFANHEHVSILATDPVEYTMEAKAPAWKFSVSVTHPAVLAEMLNPAMQSRPVKFFQLVIDEPTGAVTAAWPLYDGFINTNTAKLSKDSSTVEFEVVTAAEYLMRENEADRLTVAWQQEHFPNEKGLEFNYNAGKNPYWGADTKTASASYGGGSGYGGGGGFGGGGQYNQY